jgi:hypothetical protein
MKNHPGTNPDEHRQHYRMRTALTLGLDLIGERDSAAWAAKSTDLEQLVAIELARPDLSPDDREIYTTLDSIAKGKEIDPATLTQALAAVPGEAKLSEPVLSNGPMPDRIVGLLCADERAELQALAADVPARLHDQLLRDLKLEQAGEGTLDLLDEHERAAARLMLDEEQRGDHLNRIAGEVEASGRRLDEMKARPQILGVIHVENF